MMTDPNDNGRNLLLKAVFGALIAFVASHILLALASIPAYYQGVTAGQVPTVAVAGDIIMSNERVAEWAAERGMSVETYALYSIVFNAIITFGFVSVAALILWKARRDWFHWFTALVLLFYPTGGLERFVMVSQLADDYVALGGLLWPVFPLFLYLFPNGRAVPPWTAWLMGPLAIVHLIAQALALAAAYFSVPDELGELVFPLFTIVLAAFPLITLVQVYRYLRGSTYVERAQIKWFVVGLALWVALSLVVDLLSAAHAGGIALATGISADISELFSLLIPVAICIGILRYRLYDIDVIIRRTLIYAVLTALLAGVYFGGVVLLQALLRPLTGEGNDLAVVATTLLIAALFLPLRARVQGFIDRRFYRRKYNAAQTLAAFGAHVRDEVELDKLTDRLVEVVDETMRPAYVSLWLKQPANELSQAGKETR